MKRALTLVALGLAGGAYAQPLAPPEAASPPGTVTVSANASMAPLVRRWAEAFRRRNPGVRIEATYPGSDIAIAALYTGKADVALLGREAAEMEAKAFEWIYRYPPTRLELVGGSVGASGQSPALAVLVHRSNPIASISLEQLRAVFGAEAATIADWGALGLEGPWRGRPIALYAPEAESGTGRFFRETVLGGSNKLAWDRLTEFGEPVLPAGRTDGFGKAISRALAADPAGIAIASLDAVSPHVKAIPVSVPGAAPVLPSRGSIASGRYPLARTGYAYVNRRPGAPLGRETAAFLRFVLSPEGQAMAGGGAGYLPLAPERAAAADRLLD